METYCISFKKYSAKKKSNVRKTKQNRLMLLSNCAVCGKKKSAILKDKELYNFNDWFKMNKLINKFLLAGDKFMLELYLKQPGFTYSAYGPFMDLMEHCEKIQKFIETGNLKHFHRN